MTLFNIPTLDAWPTLPNMPTSADLRGHATHRFLSPVHRRFLLLIHLPFDRALGDFPDRFQMLQVLLGTQQALAVGGEFE